MFFNYYFFNVFYLFKKFNYSFQFTYMKLILLKSRFIMLSGAEKKEIYIFHKNFPYNIRYFFTRYNYLIPMNFRSFDENYKKIIPANSLYFYSTLRFLNYLNYYNFFLFFFKYYIFFNLINYFYFFFLCLFFFFYFYKLDKYRFIFFNKKNKKKLRKIINYKYGRQNILKSRYYFIKRCLFFFINNK